MRNHRIHSSLTRFLAGVFLCTILGWPLAYAIDEKGSPSGSSSLSHMTHTFFLEEEKVWVNVYQGSGPGLTFINLHDNENTSAEAARVHISRHGGRLVELEHGRGREVVIRRRGILHRFDPNRMFTENGRRQTLDYFHNLSSANTAIAADFARQLTSIVNIEKDKAIIAVHNNTPGKLTIKDFQPGQWYGKDAREVFISPAEDPDDFFFTNSPTIYRALRTLRYNVALMAFDPPDRGTLGNYVNHIGGIYILVEAEHGHLDRQIRMLEDLDALLSGNSPAGN